MEKVQQENNLSPRNALQPGYELLWYKIKSVLGQGAFGITYLAQDINLNRLVAIKEFLPGQYAMRDGNETVRPVSEEHQDKFTWGLRRFIDEARILDQFEHPNIVRIMNIFESNNTAYMVMGYEQGVSLKEILIKQKFLDETDLVNILIPILEGLESIHQAGFIHRDIKPANIFIRTDGTPVLLDFGSARQSLEKETQTLTSLVSPGYAPIEQYVSKSDKQGPWSDIYGMAATLYRAVTGVPPNDAITRGESLTGEDVDSLISCRELADKRYSDPFITAIEHGLEFLTRDRPQTIDEWKREFLPLGEADDLSTTIVSGHASSQVVSLVRESMTQTATRIHDGSDLADYWDKDESTSVEMAHKQGFRHGLKVALALLTLILGGLFAGNFQKIVQVVSPGFVPQDIISDKPIEMIDETVNSNQISTTDDSSQIDIKTPPPILDEDTAAELEAEGKIIIVDEIQGDLVPVKSIDGNVKSGIEGEEKLPVQEIILDGEAVIERNDTSEENADFKNPMTTNTTPVYTDDGSQLEVGETETEQEPAPKVVVIEEKRVPEQRAEREKDGVEKVRDLMDFLVENGEEGTGKGEELKGQLGGKSPEK